VAAHNIPENVYFYYVRDDKGNPFSCICFGKDLHPVETLVIGGGTECEFKWSRGVSICSKPDLFTKTAARGRAYQRFNMANRDEKTRFPIAKREHFLPPYPEVDAFIDSDIVGEIDFKSEYDVALTEFEERLTHKCDKTLV